MWWRCCEGNCSVGATEFVDDFDGEECIDAVIEVDLWRRTLVFIGLELVRWPKLKFN